MHHPVPVAVYGGPFWRAGESHEGFVRLEAGRVLEVGEGVPAGAKPAVILDGLHNYHTHVGDAFLAGRPLPRSLEALVRPGTGYKHRMLARARTPTLLAGMRRALGRHFDAGTASLLDFREQGVPGIRLAREAARSLEGNAPILRLLGRSGTPGVLRDLDEVLAAADGLGISSLTDVGSEAEAYAERTHRAGKPLAMHASEQRREDMAAILALRPQLLIHLVHATPKDLRQVRDADVPVALCPSSNRFFGLLSPVARVRRAGLRFHFGTDNAMLGRSNLLDEARLARRLDRQAPDASLLQALTTPPEKAIKRIRGVADPPGGPPRLVVLPLRRGRVQWQARALLGQWRPS